MAVSRLRSGTGFQGVRFLRSVGEVVQDLCMSLGGNPGTV